MNKVEELNDKIEKLIKYDIVNLNDMSVDPEEDRLRYKFFMIALALYFVFCKVYGFIFKHPAILILDTIVIGGFLISLMFEIRRWSKEKKATTRRDRIRKRRKGIIEEIDTFMQSNPEVAIEPWWKEFWGGTFRKPSTYDLDNIIITDRNRLESSVKKGVLSVDNILADVKERSGARILEKYVEDEFWSKHYKIYPSVECVKKDRNYLTYNMYNYSIEPCTTRHVSTVSQADVDREMNEYRQGLDRRERFSNTIGSGNDYTNEEMRYRGKMSDEEYRSKELWRSLDEMNKAEKLQKSVGKSTVSYEYNGTYMHKFSDLGMMLMDEYTGEIVAFVLTNHFSSAMAIHTDEIAMGDTCYILDYGKERLGGKVTTNWRDVVQMLEDYYEYPTRHFRRPQDCSVKDWGTWIYTQYYAKHLDEKYG